MSYPILYGTALVVSLAIDFLWIGVLARNYYRTQLGDLMVTNVGMVPAALFYLLFAAALVFFVIQPALERQSLQHALLAGAFLGLTAYATYDLVNLATLKNWPLVMSIVDMAWGTFMAMFVSGATYLIATKWWGM
jgi:uncharacterized membrane protein